MDAEPFDKLTAEQAYLFRHALVRDAAYALQLPAERAHLHRLALSVLEALLPPGERAPLAAELAAHARMAQADGDPSALAAEIEYTWLAGETARANYNPDSVRWHDRAAEINPDLAVKVRALQRAADVQVLNGHPEEARPRLLRAVDLARELGDGSLRASVLHTLAALTLMYGTREDAEQQLMAALGFARETGNVTTEAMALTNLASLMRTSGRRDEGFELQRKALALHRSTGNQRGESLCLGNVAVYHADCSNFELALAACDEALAAARANSNRRTEGIVHGTRGHALSRLRRSQEAIAEYRQAVSIHAEIYNRAYESFDRCRMALVMLELGAESEARSEWLRGHEQMLAYGHSRDLEATLGDMRKACAHYGIEPFIATSGTP